MRTAAISVFMILTPFGVCADSLFVEQARILDPGTYELKVQSRIYDPMLVGRSRNVVTDIRHVHAGTVLPARLCTSFGFAFVLVGRPRDAEVPIKMVTKFPSAGLYNPTANREHIGTKLW